MSLAKNHSAFRGGALRWSVWAVLSCCAACSGVVSDDSATKGATSGTGSTGNTGTGGELGGGPLIDDVSPPSNVGPLACTPARPSAHTRLVRLTHRQYDNTIRDLTGLALSPSADFLADQHQAGYDRGIDLQVGDSLGKGYRAAAEAIASAVIASPTSYQKVVACDAKEGESCAKTFIGQFGKRAFRRPLTEVETAKFLALFKKGPELVDSGDDFQKGVQVALEAFLQSPSFLYRVELSGDLKDGLIALSSYEIASRLSLMLVNTTPDDELLAAADQNLLQGAEQVSAAASRLILSAASRETVRDFHHQWLDLDIYANKLTKDARLFPGVGPELAPVLQQEVELFVGAVTFGARRGLSSLLTAPFTFVSDKTAKLYGLSGTFGDELTQVDLDPTRRAGLLTQVGFLATRSFSTQSSPIHRGVFLQRRLLCTRIPDPPPNIPELPAIDGTVIKTTRQQVDEHTAPAECAKCHHTVINPVGFGLENYDAVGQYRTTENGYDIDATGTLVGTEGEAPFTDGVSMAKTIAASPEARLCYAANWFRYTFGRTEEDSDGCALSTIAGLLGDDAYPATRVLIDMTRTRAFLYRAPEDP
jgi:hypothetical protein